MKPGLGTGVIVFLILCFVGCESEPIKFDWQIAEGYRWAELTKLETGSPGFTYMPSSHTGIKFQNIITQEHAENNRVLLNGSGVAAGDINGNGLIDLYFARLDGANKLYKNLGNLRFKDITNEAGVAHDGYLSTGVVFSDVNGNGHLDLLIGSIDKKNSLYLNDGNGKFTYQENSGLGEANGTMSLALADINGNQYPDLYITNYKKKSIRDIFSFTDLTRENMMVGDSLVPPFDEHFYLIDQVGQPPDPHEIGAVDEFYLNNGDGSFTKVEDPENYFLSESGEPLGFFPDWGLTAKFQDLNNNGHQDLYVANDFWTPDRIWINQGNGTFQAIDTLAIRNGSFSSMAVDFSDLNKNGLTDIFVVEMLSPFHNLRLTQMDTEYPYSLKSGDYKSRPLYNRNSLYINRGDHTYVEQSYYSGLEASDWSWTNKFLDVTLNGHEDVIISTGFKYDFQNMDAQMRWIERLRNSRGERVSSVADFPSLRQTNKSFINHGNLKFSETTKDWGFNAEDISFGLVVADLNNNGMLDVVFSRMNDEPAIYRNDSPGNRIAVRLIGSAPNTQAIGARVVLQGGELMMQSKQIISGGDYLSGSDPLIVFAAMPNENHELTITWPNRTQSIISDLKANRIYEIFQDSISTTNPIVDFKQQLQETYFEDQSKQLAHKHYESSFDDFLVQPLLPLKLSQLGPAIAWLDITGSGEENLLIGSGKGGVLSAFEYSVDGTFREVNVDERLMEYNFGDMTGIVGWVQNERTHLVIGNSNYELNSITAPSAYYFQFEDGQIVKADSLEGIHSATGHLAAADYTGNGYVDLFVAGRFMPAQYPKNATSRLFKNQNGNLIADTENNYLFEDIGLVTSAIFVDYNNNGNQDLIITTEWGAIRLFENNEGKFTENTSDLGLADYYGMWQGIASGDFTGNGYPDLVVTNWGENSPYQIRSPEFPLKMFYDDFNWNRRTDILEAYYDDDIGGYVPRRQIQEYESLFSVIPHIQSHEEFSHSTIETILQTNIEDIPSKKINTLQHIVLINLDGKGFKIRPLPVKAQLSNGFYVGVADIDNNGIEDLFMSQNYFGVPIPQKKPRQDGGRGLWMKGDGEGNFEVVPGYLSGIKIYGEQRGATLGDFNKDGRIDLVVSQNSSDTRLFKNKVEKKGYRIRLNGPPENSSAIGSSLRLIYSDGKKGPRRYVQAGSGYLSQNSAIQVMGYSDSVIAVEVHWYNGKFEIYNIESDQREIDIDFSI